MVTKKISAEKLKAKIHYLSKKRYKYIKGLSFLLALSFVFFVLFIPKTSYKIGNFFFGEYGSSFYNINLAQLFYTHATHPLLPIAPPQYAHHQLSRTYFIQGHLRTALNEAKKELALYPNSTKTYYILGLTYAYMHLEEKGIEAFTKYIEAHPLTWAGRNDKAWLQFRIGDIFGAINTMSPLAHTQPGNPWVQNTYCALMISTKNYNDAEKHCLQAKEAVGLLTVEAWGKAYPGNDPRIHDTGPLATKKSIELNLNLIHKHRTPTK